MKKMPSWCFGSQLEHAILQSAKPHFKHDATLLANVFSDCSDAHINHILFIKSLDTPLHVACRSGSFGAGKNQRENGGFKTMWNHNEKARLLVHCATPRVNRMLLKELLIQIYLSKYSFVPNILSFKVSRSGSLTIPIYEAIIEMPLLQATLMAFFNSAPTCEDIVAMFAQVISAMHTINTAGFFHNDMKLDNIMACDEKHKFRDAFGLEELECDKRWHIIDYGLCSPSSKTGDDLFFFCWWVYNRAYACIDQCNLLALFRWVLNVPKHEIPLNLHDHIGYQTTATHIDFTSPLNADPNTKPGLWSAISKEALYSCAQQKTSSISLEEFLKGVYEATSVHAN